MSHEWLEGGHETPRASHPLAHVLATHPLDWQPVGDDDEIGVASGGSHAVGGRRLRTGGFEALRGGGDRGRRCGDAQRRRGVGEEFAEHGRQLRWAHTLVQVRAGP